MSDYYFKIWSTIEIFDELDKIKVDDSLYNTDEIETFKTYDEAMNAGQEVLDGLNGGRAFNKALETAEITVERVPFYPDKITPQNIRQAYEQLESDKLSEKADGNYNSASEIDRMMQNLLQKMTQEQRSWCLDDHSEIPSETFKEIMEKIKEQEQG